MTDPFDELAAELGVETIKPPPSEEPPPLPPIDDAEPAPADLADQIFADDAGEIAEPGLESEVIELGGTDEQKKRRRRRRRKKRGEPEDAGEEQAAEADVVAQPSELLRDIIRSWDVPSWDDIVAGLYRPNR